jgi:hypothetical protein
MEEVIPERKNDHYGTHQHQVFESRIQIQALPGDYILYGYSRPKRQFFNGMWQSLLFDMESGKEYIVKHSFHGILYIGGFLAALTTVVSGKLS